MLPAVLFSIAGASALVLNRLVVLTLFVFAGDISLHWLLSRHEKPFDPHSVKAPSAAAGEQAKHPSVMCSEEI